MWVTWRLTKHLYRRVKDQWNGIEDRLTNLQNDWMYEDFYRDSDDSRYVNFRYSDHEDRVEGSSHDTTWKMKPAADKGKQAWKWYKTGNDSWLSRLLDVNKLS